MGEEKKFDKEAPLHVVHYSVNWIPKAEWERAIEFLVAEKGSSAEECYSPVGVANSADDTFRVVLPPVSYLKLRRLLRAFHQRH